MINIELTEDQYDLLKGLIWSSQDEGPEGHGWKSEQLQELADLIDSAGEDNGTFR